MSFTFLRKASLFIIIALALMVLLGACRGSRYGWQATAEAPTPSGVDTSLTIDDITPTPTPSPDDSDGHEPEPTHDGDGGVDLVAMGLAASQANGCIGCHSIDGSTGVGPSWQGLFGKTETLEDGSTVHVDDAYLMESILEPGAKIVDGFPAGMMPASYNTISEDDLRGIIEYIKTLQ